MSRCRSCQAPIVWAFTTSGKRIPLDPDPVDDGNVVLSAAVSPGQAPTAIVLPVGQPTLDDDPRYVSHFATCPNADTHRRT